MKENEAIECIKGKLDCMKKCDTFDCLNIYDCDECNYCYAQGTFGEQKEAFEIAINVLEKQIPKKAKEKDCISLNKFSCPECKMVLYLYQPYCDNCGQEIDWSDVE